MSTFLRLLSCAVLLWASPALAHHGGGGGGAFSINPVISQQLARPRHNLSLTFDASWLDQNVGTVLLYQLEGEYAFSPRWSIGGRLPFWSVYSDFIPSSQKIGDIAVFFKSQVLRAENYSLLVGLDTSFPTGNDQVSRGAGTVVLTPFANFARDFRVLQFYTLLGASFESASEVNPSLNYELGLIFPIVREKLPLSFLMAFRGNTFIVSDTFEPGSTKALLVGGFLLQASRHWEMGLMGKFSILDTLDFKPTVQSNNFVTGLLNDVKAGFSLTLNYQF